jgi:hypothetical protein
MVIFYYFINNKKALKKENYLLRDFLFLRFFIRDFLFLRVFLRVFLRRPPAKGEAHPQPPPLFFVFLRRPPIVAGAAGVAGVVGVTGGSVASGASVGGTVEGVIGAVAKGFGIEMPSNQPPTTSFSLLPKGQNPPLILCLRFVRLFFVLFLRIYKLLILFYDSIFI